MIESTKNILYIVLGILTFIFIVIALYFLFIKKKPYTCSPDNCESPKSCQGNVCTPPYTCSPDNCESPKSCQGNVCTPYTCSPDNCESPKSCKGNICTDVGLSCEGNVCTPYTCSPTNCTNGNCVGNVCQPSGYNCEENCVAPSGSGSTAMCKNNMCFLQYDNPKGRYWGCQSKELPKDDPSTESSSAEWNGSKALTVDIILTN
jgi:hypothetical protein